MGGALASKNGSGGLADPRLTAWLCRHPLGSRRTTKPLLPSTLRAGRPIAQFQSNHLIGRAREMLGHSHRAMQLLKGSQATTPFQARTSEREQQSVHVDRAMPLPRSPPTSPPVPSPNRSPAPVAPRLRSPTPPPRSAARP